MYDVLAEIKRLVEDYESAISSGKTALSTGSIELALQFVDSAKNVATRTQRVLEATKDALSKYNQDDKLYKYVSAYYRMALLVSIPYTIMILRHVSVMLDRNGYTDKAKEARDLADSFENTINTLKF